MSYASLLRVTTSPRDLTIISYPQIKKLTSSPSTVNFISLFNGLARSLLIDNQDGANSASYFLNGNSQNVNTIAASSFRSFSDQWIEQFDFSTGASTNLQLTAEIVPLDQIQFKDRL